MSFFGGVEQSTKSLFGTLAVAFGILLGLYFLTPIGDQVESFIANLRK